MDKGFKNACKFYTYVVESDLNCFNVSWTLMDYSKLEIGKEYQIKPKGPNQCYFYLDFKKNSYKSELCVSSSGKVTSDISTTFFNEDGKELFSTNKTGVSIGKHQTMFSYYEESKLRKDSNSLPNDTLIIDLEFRIKQVRTWDVFEEGLNDYKTEGKFSSDLNRFILQNHPTMVVLKTNDDQIEAHKAILCARSSVFKNMFKNPMSEQENDIVLIEDIKGDTLKLLTFFMYRDDAPLRSIDSSSLNELYYAADKYDVQDLRNMCAAHILHELTLENVCGALELALKHSDDHMKKGCMIFIRRNIVPFMKSEGWKDLKTSYPDLGNEIFEFYVTGNINSK